MAFSLFKKLNLVVVGIVTGYIAVAAYGTWLFVDRPSDETIAKSQQTQNNETTTPHKQNVSVKETHIFGTPPDKVKEAKNTKYQLKGIVVNGSDRGIAIISVNGKDQFLKQGDKVENGTVIKKIEKERVLIMKNGETMYLSIFKEFKPRPYIAEKNLNRSGTERKRAKFSREEMIERYRKMDPEALREKFQRGFGGSGGEGYERLQQMMERRRGMLGGEGELGYGADQQNHENPRMRGFRGMQR